MTESACGSMARWSSTTGGGTGPRSASPRSSAATTTFVFITTRGMGGTSSGSTSFAGAIDRLVHLGRTGRIRTVTATEDYRPGAIGEAAGASVLVRNALWI